MEREKIERINELARKKKTVGLTHDELVEQAALRQEYLRDFRASFDSQLAGIIIQNPDGTQVPLQKKKPQ